MTYHKYLITFLSMFLSLLFAFCLSRKFEISGNNFQLDGKPFQFASAAFHYFRQHPYYWEETMKKIRNGGCNVVETYIAWNMHEPTKGNWNWEGMMDVERWLQLAQKYDLLVILRPGPYICSEWEFGAFPYWLLQEKNIVFRRDNPVYMEHVTNFLTIVLNKIKPYMIYNGGPIIMCQVENEYGSYKECDKVYMGKLCNLTRKILGDEAVLFTNDGPSRAMLDCGNILPFAYATVDFGEGDPMWELELERSYNGGTGPYFDSEFYTGKLDHWKEPHNTRNPTALMQTMDKIFSNGGSVNMYMYFGGTSFGFMNGANGDLNTYQPQTTSYDHDAPLTEAGDMSYKYEVFKQFFKKYFPDTPDFDVHNTTKKDYGNVQFTEGVSLYDALDIVGQRKAESTNPMTFEDLDVDYGYVLYQTTIKSGGVLKIPKIHDRAHVYVNRQYYGTFERPNENTMKVTVPAGDLDILVENLGRLNYGNYFVEFKGIIEGVTLDGKNITGWKQTGFNLTNSQNIVFNKKGNDLPVKIPSFYRATFYVDELGDTFLNPRKFMKGVAFVNGNNIGRYWLVGPQITLYCPMPFLKQGENELVIFDIDNYNTDTIGPMSFDDTPQIDSL